MRGRQTVLTEINESLTTEVAVRALIPIALSALFLLPASVALSDEGYTFRNCAEARAAGYSDIRHGTYGYGPHLDRDNDGIGCES